ncbi:MAG: heme exporter protein CcmD [Xanthomonadaceae bacterium]|nr:heme exporter protein CcmD [Xanthomonadaceae bacterium]
MSYRDYVIAAYAVFALMLLWDWLAPKLAISRALRAALQLSKRRAARDGHTEAQR